MGQPIFWCHVPEDSYGFTYFKCSSKRCWYVGNGYGAQKCVAAHYMLLPGPQAYVEELPFGLFLHVLGQSISYFGSPGRRCAQVQDGSLSVDEAREASRQL